MDHIVYLETSSKELENLISKEKSYIIRGATGRKLPYNRVKEGDSLYFVNNNGEGLIKAKATVKNTIFTDKLSEEDSCKIFDIYNKKALLTTKAVNRFRGKRYLSLIEVKKFQEVPPFAFDKTEFQNMDDWLIVGEISRVKV